MRDPRAILITGASSGIGAALARLYAAPGITLALNGRDKERLCQVAHDCQARGAAVLKGAIDVTNRAAIAAWIREADANAPLDLVIANAGISAGTGAGGETEDQARTILAVNLDGVLNTLHPALDAMLTRPHSTGNWPRGQIALMSSLASFRGFGGAPAYCASKAAVRIYAEALRNTYAADGIEVASVCPGFVRTAMTTVNRFPMPFLVDADKAARVIQRGLARNASRIAFPAPAYFLTWIIQALPPGLTDRLIQRLPAKERSPSVV